MRWHFQASPAPIPKQLGAASVVPTIGTNIVQILSAEASPAKGETMECTIRTQSAALMNV